MCTKINAYAEGRERVPVIRTHAPGSSVRNRAEWCDTSDFYFHSINSQCVRVSARSCRDQLDDRRYGGVR